jgi:HK97 family phage major capsid protein
MYMSKILLEERARLAHEAEQILDSADTAGRAMSQYQETRYNDIVARLEEIKVELDKPAGNRGRAGGDGPLSFAPSTVPIEEELAQLSQRSIRSRLSSPRLILPANDPVLLKFGETPRRAEENAYRSGMWLFGQLYGNEHASQWCNQHGLRIYNAASEGVNTLGGHLTPEELDRAIIQIITEFGVARQECRIRPMGSDTRNIPKRKTGLRAFFVGEGQPGTESDKEWTNVGLNAKKLMVLTRMSSEISEDAVIDLALDFTEEIGLAFAETEDDCLFNGDGASSFGGIHGIRTKLIDGTHNAGVVEAAATHDTFAEIDADDLSNLVAACPTTALRNATFYLSRVAYAKTIFSILQAAGGVTMNDMVNGPVKLGYLGYPIVLCEKMPTTLDAINGEVMILFGDMRKAAELGARRGTRVMLSEHAHWETDQIGVKGTERMDINAHGLGDNDTAGQMVGLIGKTS